MYPNNVIISLFFLINSCFISSAASELYSAIVVSKAISKLTPNQRKNTLNGLFLFIDFFHQLTCCIFEFLNGFIHYPIIMIHNREIYIRQFVVEVVPSPKSLDLKVQKKNSNSLFELHFPSLIHYNLVLSVVILLLIDEFSILSTVYSIMNILVDMLEKEIHLILSFLLS